MTTATNTLTLIDQATTDSATDVNAPELLSVNDTAAANGVVNTRLDSHQLNLALSLFCGTENWYRHGLNRNLHYTEGVQFFAEYGGYCGAYWLIDKIAFEYWPLLKPQDFLTITLTVGEDNKATVVVSDGNSHDLKTTAIDYTDMQPGIWTFFLTDNVLMLPTEY
jgi:hypothetical protein